jgi:hypothetical protein
MSARVKPSGAAASAAIQRVERSFTPAMAVGEISAATGVSVVSPAMNPSAMREAASAL